MAKERKYGFNGELPAKTPSGQALIVLNGLREEPTAMRTGKEWTETIGPRLATRQDPYRVVLYYILILKNKGVVRTEEFDIDAVTKDAATSTRHAVTVRSAASVIAGDEIIEPTTVNDDIEVGEEEVASV